MPSTIERGFVPLPKVEQEQPEDNIGIYLNLPSYVDQDRIGVNLRDIAGLCKLGGIRQLLVIGQTDKETSHVIPEVSGLQADGSATASSKMAKVIVPTFEARMDDLGWGRTDRIETRWIGLSVNMNMDEIALRVSEKTGGLHATKNWTKELDKGFKTPIRKAGNQNLLHNLESFDKFTLGLMGAVVGGVEAIEELGGGQASLERVALFAFVYTFVAKVDDASTLRGNPDHRFSIFPGPQIDRAIALSILSRTRTLIKDLYQEKK
jgi:hypothetical protein